MNKKKFEIGRQVTVYQTMEYSSVGICVNCAQQKNCSYPKTANKMFCEEYEI